MRQTTVLLTLLFIAIINLGQLGCKRAEDRYTAVVVRDSAGIKIVENRDSLHDAAAAIRLSDAPVLSIGVLSGSPEYEFNDVVDATRFSDGRIAVADQGFGEIRIFQEDGNFYQAVGRQGDGPGEFRHLSSIELGPADSILAFDPVLDRVTVFAPFGEFARVITFDRRVAGAPSEVARLKDGTFVSGAAWSSSHVPPERQALGRSFRSSSPLLRFSANGALMDTIGIFPDWDLSVWQIDGDQIVASPPFARWLEQAVHGARLYVGSQGRNEVSIYTPDGQLVGMIRWASRDLDITSEEVEDLRMAMLRSNGGGPDAERSVQNWFAAPLPAARPAYGRILIDDIGRLWVSEHPGTWMIEPSRWTVFDTAGWIMGTINVPERLRIFEIGKDYLLGRWRDELDVEYVQLYGLTRSSSARVAR